jgi:hypothetical protein
MVALDQGGRPHSAARRTGLPLGSCTLPAWFLKLYYVCGEKIIDAGDSRRCT